MLLLSAAAEAARLPVYREPPKYKGRTKAPPTQPPPAPTPAAAAVLSETGYKPDVIVDEAGTAHIVWAEGNGDGADTAGYCRLKRGATTCDHTATLVWNKDYGAGDGPQFNTDYGGPRIVRVGNQLVVFSKRYPTSGEKPDGASSSTVVQWVSSDGGNTWNDNAQIAGKLDLGQLQVLGPEDDPSILNVTIDPLCSAPGPAAWCIQQFRSGQYSGATGNLSDAANQNYYPGVALDETGRPVAVATDAGGNAFVRRWSGQGSPLDSATWGPTASWVADGPVVAGGPAGVWMMSETTFNTGPFSVRRINVNGDGTGAPGPPTDVSENHSDIFAELFQDPSGRLHAAWEQRSGDRPGVKLRSSGPAGWGPVLHLFDGESAGAISVGAAADGGGFAAIDRNVGKSNSGVVAVGFGNQAATGQAGLGDIPGGAGTNTNVSCQKVDFGKFAVESPGGCLLEGSGKFQNLVVSTQELTIHGLRIVPDPGTKVIIDPKKLQIDTTGPVQVIVSNASAQIVLFHGPLHTDLSSVAPGTNLFQFPSQAFKANVLGFPVAGDIPVELTADGVHIPVDISLPPEFGGFTGHADLLANESGLQIDSLRIHAGPIYLGALTLKTIDVNWTGGGTWDGHAALVFPATGTFSADISFVDGDFAGAHFDLPLNPPQPIGPFVYLLSVDGGFKLEPAVRIDAGASVGAGAPIAGSAPVNVRGEFTMMFPKSQPASFLLHGTASIFVFSFADLRVEFQTDGYAQVRGETNVELGPIQLGGTAQGWIEAGSGNFSAELKGGVKFCTVKCTGPEASAAFSPVGVAACGELAGESVGLEMTWEEFTSPETVAELAVPGIGTLAFLADKIAAPCNSSKYFTPPPRPFSARTSASGGQIVTIPRGLPSATLVAIGESQAPNVTVTGPNGFKTTNGLVFPRIPATYVVIENPKPGDYTIAPDEGSVDIVRVLASNGYRPAAVKARIRGRKIAYRVANLAAGQRVVFQERGRFGAHTLGAVKKSRGTLRFKPAAGRGGKRTVYALIQKDGFTTRTAKVGTFTAPSPPKPGAVGRLRAVHKAHRLTISWRAARRAASYVVKIRGSKGTRITRALGRKSRRLKLAAVRRDERFTVSVNAVAKSLRAGAVRTAKSR
jgi:hypothetical protein